MGLIAWMRSWFSRPTRQQLPDADAETFVFIVIRDSIGPIARGEAYEDGLDAALRSRGLGEVTGGGSRLGDERPDGTRPIEWCGVDVEITQASTKAEALAALRSELQRLNAPVGSELHYTDVGIRLLDRLDSAGWTLRQRRQDLHPAFGF